MIMILAKRKTIATCILFLVKAVCVCVDVPSGRFVLINLIVDAVKGE